MKDLNKMINDESFEGGVLNKAKDLRSSFQKKYDYYYGALQRAANKNNKTINVKSTN